MFLSVFAGLNFSAYADTDVEDGHVHTEIIDEAVPATCTEAGLTEGSHCSVCGEVLVAQTEVAALGHQWDDGEVSGNGEVITYTCTVCGEKTKSETNPDCKNGWYKENGNLYLYKNDEMQKYWHEVDGRRYYMNSKGIVVTGWLKVKDVWYYLGTGGAMAVAWRYINKKWYYFKENGIMYTGWSVQDGKKYYLNANGSMQTGWKKIDGKWYYFNVSGAMLTGWQKSNNKWYYLNSSGEMLTFWHKINNKWYYFNSSGAMQANTVIGNKTTGYYWVTNDGSYDTTVRDAKVVNGSSWLILNGKAKPVTSENDKTLYRAFKTLDKCTDSSMTKSQKLKAAWDHLRTSYVERSPRTPHYRGLDWPTVYANDIFVRGFGNCMSYASSFAYMAKAIGYNDCYVCNSGTHAWAEIEGLVYDPERSMHHFKYSYYALSYDTKTDKNYKDDIAANKPFMHVEIHE